MSNTPTTLEYLKRKEWSMGNGQCPECCGISKEWYGHAFHTDPNEIGHYHGCVLAKMMTEHGESPLMKGDFESNVELDTYIVNGCPVALDYRPEGALTTKEWSREVAFARIEEIIASRLIKPTEED